MALLACFLAGNANAQKLGSLVQTNQVASSDTLPITIGTNTWKVSVSDLLASTNINAGGATTQLQFNDAGDLAGSVGMTWDKAVRRLVLENTNTATTITPMLILSNATPGTVGVPVQASPSIYWSGHTYLTGSLSNAPVTFRMEMIPVSGSVAPAFTTALKIDASVNNAAFGASLLSLDYLGSLSIINDFVTSGRITGGTSQGIGWLSKSLLYSSANGAIEANNNNSSARSTIQFNIPQVTKTSNYTNLTRLDSGLRLTNIGAVASVTNFLETAVAQDRHFYYVDAAQVLSVKAAAGDVIHNAGTPTSSGGDIWSATQYSTLMLFCPKAGHWVVEAITGTWAVN